VRVRNDVLKWKYKKLISYFKDKYATSIIDLS